MSDPLEKARKAQRIVNAYHRVFGSADGKLIMEDIKAAFGVDFPAFIPQERGRHMEFDPYHAAIRDGQRQVFLHVMARLSAPAAGDDEPKVKRARVKK